MGTWTNVMIWEEWEGTLVFHLGLAIHHIAVSMPFKGLRSFLPTGYGLLARSNRWHTTIMTSYSMAQTIINIAGGRGKVR